MKREIELLAPAGDLEKLKTAILYGADAVYMGGDFFGLRARAKNFSKEEMKEGIEFAHNRGKKVYITVNIIAHNADFAGLEAYLLELNELKVDALIVSDPGIFSVIKALLPHMEIHISTQANVTNSHSVGFWKELGAKRIILAREMSLSEITEIKKAEPDMYIEAFIHGAMCMSYSGRCLLSNYMAHRDANQGDCAQPCRWKYHLMEEQRPGEFMPVYENERGTFIFNSKDLAMLAYIPEILATGLDSLKIEGRMKTNFYVANVVRAYRKAIDAALESLTAFESVLPMAMEDIKRTSYREYTTGFYFGKPDEKAHVYGKSTYNRSKDFVGVILDYNNETQVATIEQRNKFIVGDRLELLSFNGDTHDFLVSEIINETGEKVSAAPHPQEIIRIKIDKNVKPFEILYK